MNNDEFTSDITVGHAEPIRSIDCVPLSTHIELAVKVRHLEDKILELEKWKESNKPTGICESCIDITLKENDILKNTVNKLKKIFSLKGNYTILEEIVDDAECIILKGEEAIEALHPKVEKVNEIRFDLSKIMEEIHE